MASDFIAHVEIPSTDLDRSADFLKKIFGWEFKPFGNGYHLFNTHKGFTIGLRKAEKINAGDSTIFHIRVNDISKILSLVGDAGGHVYRGKTTIPAMGYYALINDPDGNVIGLFQGN
ncbi:MAG TPA: VOC family protein [Ignavibacteriaceae bacterium]|nr:VOC family protein [Ignavibacteriaceae bacterium]